MSGSQARFLHATRGCRHQPCNQELLHLAVEQAIILILKALVLRLEFDKKYRMCTASGRDVQGNKWDRDETKAVFTCANAQKRRDMAQEAGRGHRGE